MSAPLEEKALTASPDLLQAESNAFQTGTAPGDAASLHRRRNNQVSEDGEAATTEKTASNEDPSDRPIPPPRRPTRQGTSILNDIAKLFEPERKLGKEPNYAQSWLAITKASWLNVLIVFIPISWALHYTDAASPTVVFVMSFIAIIPLAKLLGFATEEIALRVGQTIGGLVNATLGNVVELIVAIIALTKCQLEVVQSSLLGSILSNLLLVLGCCFFFGGIRFSEQAFKPAGVQANSSLLMIAAIAILIPSAYHAAFGDDLPNDVELPAILSMSRGTAVIVLVIYFAYLFFQLFTHTHMFTEGKTVEPAPRPLWGSHKVLKQARSARSPSFSNQPNIEIGPEIETDEEPPEMPSINIISCILLLIGVTVLVAFTAEFLVDSINGLVAANPSVSKAWVGLILLPIVGNAAEHVTAVTVAVKDKLDLSIGVAVGSSIQIALFVVPLLVIIAWGLGKPLSLLFDPFEATTLFLSILLVNYVVADNRSNWLEGFILLCVYIIIALSFWYYPSAQTSTSILLNTCN